MRTSIWQIAVEGKEEQNGTQYSLHSVLIGVFHSTHWPYLWLADGGNHLRYWLNFFFPLPQFKPLFKASLS